MSQHLRDVEDRLVDRYTQRQNIPADRVRQAFSLATEHFANARIHAYLPILLERAVDRQLNGR